MRDEFKIKQNIYNRKWYISYNSGEKYLHPYKLQPFAYYYDSAIEAQKVLDKFFKEKVMKTCIGIIEEDGGYYVRLTYKNQFGDTQHEYLSKDEWHPDKYYRTWFVNRALAEKALINMARPKTYFKDLKISDRFKYNILPKKTLIKIPEYKDNVFTVNCFCVEDLNVHYIKDGEEVSKVE